MTSNADSASNPASSYVLDKGLDARMLIRNLDAFEPITDVFKEVLIESETRPGFYAGVGFNFNLTKVFAINYDMRYHVVDFTDNRFENGFEIGIGFSFMWGKFKK